MPVWCWVLCLAPGALLVLLGLWLLLMKPGRRRPGMAEAAARCYAHRGLWDLGEGVAENSLSAFRRAAEAGVAVELDVQLSRDGVVMVYHDDKLGRVAEGEGRVMDRTAAELGRLSLSGTADTLPTLRQVLEVIDGRVPILMEVKAEHHCEEVCRAAAAVLRGYRGEVLMESFNPLAVRWFRRHLPGMLRGVLCARFFRDKPFRKPLYLLLWGMVLNVLCRPDFAALCLRDSRDLPFCLLRRVWRCPTLWWTGNRAAPGMIFEARGEAKE